MVHGGGQDLQRFVAEAGRGARLRREGSDPPNDAHGRFRPIEDALAGGEPPRPGREPLVLPPRGHPALGEHPEDPGQEHASVVRQPGEANTSVHMSSMGRR